MTIDIKKIDDFCFKIPRSGMMRVPGLVFTSQAMMAQILKDRCLEQVINVASLPGITGYSMAMPDIHQGYGFPIGGVAAFDWENGVVSPGGVGYDINCGVRLCTTSLEKKDIIGKEDILADALFHCAPSGVGATGPLNLSFSELKQVLKKGSAWAVEKGMGVASDLDHTEENGCIKGAAPAALSQRAMSRGKNQLGTLGSGNHFLEICLVEEICDEAAAAAFGIYSGTVALMLHCGSRGLGYQVCDDSLKSLTRHSNKMGFDMPDHKLCSALIKSPQGEQYLSAMAAAANYAWANRQIIMHNAREAMMKALKISPGELGMRLVYDVAHNIAKKEEHIIKGKKKMVCVHRKGATRAFGPGHPDLPQDYKKQGQPVLVPGDMGRGSYVLCGTKKAMETTFGSTCHGAGRVLSRKAAKKTSRGRAIDKELAKKGITVRWTGRSTLHEEFSEAYKDVNQVVEVVHKAGIARKVARLSPLIVVKG